MNNTSKAVITGQQNYDFVVRYSSSAPFALAFERSLESSLYSGKSLAKPVLDLGCGDGIFAEVTFGKGSLVDYGVDPNPAEIERAKLRGAYNQLFCTTGDKIPLQDASVATVISNSVLEHIPALDPVLQELRRILKNDGELHITIPTHQFERYSGASQLLRGLGLKGLDQKFRNFYNRFWNHYHAYDAASWQQILRKNGFEIVEFKEYCPRIRTLAHDLLVPFAVPAFVINKLVKRYFLFPKVRGVWLKLVRKALPDNAVKICKPGTGGLIYIYAKKAG